VGLSAAIAPGLEFCEALAAALRQTEDKIALVSIPVQVYQLTIEKHLLSVVLIGQNWRNSKLKAIL
jgi:hypothetical protein